MESDEDFKLSPIDDDLGLAPLRDEAADRSIAPDLPFQKGTKLVPIICSVCKTRLHAGVEQIGLWKKCPVCDRLTQIPEAPPQSVFVANDPEAAGGYGIEEPDLTRKDILKLKEQNRREREEYIKKTLEDKAQSVLDPIPALHDQPPLMERMLDSLLKSKDEKVEEDRIAQREEAFTQETDALRKAMRDGRVDEHLARSGMEPDKAADPVARKLAEKQRRYEQGRLEHEQRQEAGDSQAGRPRSSPAVPPPLPPPLPSQTAPPVSSLLAQAGCPRSSPAGPPPLPLPLPSQTAPPLLLSFAQARCPRSGLPPLPTPMQAGSERQEARDLPDTTQAGPSFLLSGAILEPLFDSRCRARMIILLVSGFVGNLLGEKARSMIWQVLVDRVYGRPPGYSYNAAESGLFLFTFWGGAVLTIIWLTMLFLFGLSLFQETAAGKDRVRTWSPFSLDFGISYIFWSLVILWGAAYPGILIWQGISYYDPTARSEAFVLVPLIQFFCYPILFLCVIESDTFFGNWPRKTLSSLGERPGLWFRLYAVSLILIAIPVFVFVSLYKVGTTYEEHWIMQSWLYYLVASVLLTFCGFFVLLYFRLLGLAAREVKVEC